MTQRTLERQSQISTLESIFRKAYDKIWKEKAGTSTIRVVQHENPSDDNSPISKVYEQEGNFFLCGFSGIRFSVKGKNRDLLKVLKSEGIEVRNAYPNGKKFTFKYGQQGNGDHQIQVEAYHKIAEFLNNLGYNTWVEDILD